MLLGLTYLERWYNFSYGQVNVKDLVMYRRTSLVKGNASPLDTLIELGNQALTIFLLRTMSILMVSVLPSIMERQICLAR